MKHQNNMIADFFVVQSLDGKESVADGFRVGVVHRESEKKITSRRNQRTFVECSSIDYSQRRLTIYHLIFKELLKQWLNI